MKQVSVGRIQRYPLLFLILEGPSLKVFHSPTLSV